MTQQHSIPELSSARVLFVDSWRLYRQHWRIYARLLFVGISPLIIWSVLGAVEWAWQSAIGQHLAQTGIGSIVALSAVTIINTIALVGGILLLLLGWVGHIIVTRALIIGHAASVKEALRLAWRRLPAYVWTTVLATVLIKLGFVVFIIPGIIAWCWYSFAPYILADRGISGWPALTESRRLIIGWWWEIYNRFLWLLYGYIIVGLVGWFVVAAIDDILTAWSVSAIAQLCIHYLTSLVSVGLGLVMASFGIVYRSQCYSQLLVVRQAMTRQAVVSWRYRFGNLVGGIVLVILILASLFASVMTVVNRWYIFNQQRSIDAFFIEAQQHDSRIVTPTDFRAGFLIGYTDGGQHAGAQQAITSGLQMNILDSDPSFVAGYIVGFGQACQSYDTVLSCTQKVRDRLYQINQAQ